MADKEPKQLEEPGAQMSFLEHLDELRRRLVNVVIILVIAFIGCWFASGAIYKFLAVPIKQVLSEVDREKLSLDDKKVIPLTDVQRGDKGRYVFPRAARVGSTAIPAGSSVETEVQEQVDGNLGLFTTEALFTNNGVIPSGVRLPVDLKLPINTEPDTDARLIVTTAAEQFTLYVTVSMYAAIAISIPLLLWQIWGFISPALYKHERAYVTPFIGLSSVSFVLGAAFAYYVLFPPALRYLLNLGGGEFQLLLKGTDYFDFIVLIMLAMGLIFQMPAITYVLARIGIVSAEFLVRVWKISVVVILVIAAVASPTGDIPNMMLFAAPMFGLYIISIFIAWLFGKKRVKEPGD